MAVAVAGLRVGDGCVLGCTCRYDDEDGGDVRVGLGPVTAPVPGLVWFAPVPGLVWFAPVPGLVPACPQWWPMGGGVNPRPPLPVLGAENKEVGRGGVVVGGVLEEGGISVVCCGGCGCGCCGCCDCGCCDCGDCGGGCCMVGGGCCDRTTGDVGDRESAGLAA